MQPWTNKHTQVICQVYGKISVDMAQFKCVKVRPFQSGEIVTNGSIFLLETNEERLELEPSTLCAIESVSKAYAEKPVYLLLTEDSPVKRVPVFLQLLDNFRARRLNMDETFRYTPLEEFWKNRKLHLDPKSPFRHSHLSDLLRSTLLYKFGGRYLDSDVITTKRFPDDIILDETGHVDFTVAVNETKLGSAFLNFGVGHPFIKATLEELAKSFDSTVWGANGPLLFTKIANSFCDEDFSVEHIMQCGDFKVLPPHYVFPFRAREWEVFYKPEKYELVKSRMLDSYALHYFTGMKSKEPEKEYKMEPNQPIYKIFKQYCPLVVKHVLEA